MRPLATPTDYSHKSILGKVNGWAEMILYLSPRTEALTPERFVNLCPRASSECFKHCLIHSGQMIMPHAKAARIRRTQLLDRQPELFGRQLISDIGTHLRWCARRDLKPAFRFNGTSDFFWESWVVPHLGQTLHQYLLETAPEAIVNEYTKREYTMFAWLRGEYPPNLHMTFSLNEENEQHARAILGLGGNVAIVFQVKKGQPLPSSWWGYPVLDGDVDDLRWLDNQRARRQGLVPPCVIGLRHKGVLARTNSPFSLDPQSQVVRLERAA